MVRKTKKVVSYDLRVLLWNQLGTHSYLKADTGVLFSPERGPCDTVLTERGFVRVRVNLIQRHTLIFYVRSMDPDPNPQSHVFVGKQSHL